MSWKTNKRRRLPILRFSPYAWAKLLFLRDRGPTEVGGFGIAAAADLLFVEDICLIQQFTTAVTVRFDDAAVAGFFDEQVDHGLKPERFGRIWLHTHPGNSAWPSCTDEAAFARCFGKTDWAVMAILASEGQTYARLQFNVGPKAAILVPVEIDYGRSFPQTNEMRWIEEYERCVAAETMGPSVSDPLVRPELVAADGWGMDEWSMEPLEEVRRG